MSVSRRHIRVALVIGIVLGIVAVPVLGSVLSGFIATSGTIPVSTNTDTTVKVSGASDLAGTEWTFDNTVEIRTDQGNVTVVGNGQANVSIAAGDITGTHTNTTALDVQNAVTINPEDKAKLTVNGAATEAAWTDYAVDDGTVDTVINGPDGTSSDVTYYGLAGDSTFTAVNKTTGTPLDVATSDSSGQVTFTIDHSEQTILLQSGDQSTTPTQSNANPTGELTNPPSELSVDIGDADFPTDNVTVDIDLDGSDLSTQSVTANETVTASIPSSGTTGGQRTWTVNATDKFGNSNETTYTYQVPSKVYIYNVTPNESTGKHESIGDTVTVEATFAGSDETVQETETSSGYIDFSGLPPDEAYVITLSADDYYTRSVYVPSLYEQTSVFLLNKSQPSVENSIELEDRTGNYQDQPVVQVQRVINRSNVANMSGSGYEWVTISGERVSATNFLVVNLEQDSVNRFVVTNDEGDSRVLGEYVARTDATLTLEIGSISYKFGDENQGYDWTANIENTSSGGLITFAYDDQSNLTDSITLKIRDRGNGTVIASETFTSGPYGELVYTKQISQSQYENQTWEVSWSADRDGETISAVRPVGGQGLLDFGALDSFWLTAGFALIAFVLAFAVGAGISAGAGGLAVAGWMGIAWYIGAVPTELGAGAIILAFLVAAWTTVNEQQTEVIQ